MHTQNWDTPDGQLQVIAEKQRRQGYFYEYLFHRFRLHKSFTQREQRTPAPCSCPSQCLIAQGDRDFRTQSDYPQHLPQQAGIHMEIIAFSLRQKFVIITHVSFNIEQCDSLLQAPVILGDFAEGGIKQG